MGVRATGTGLREAFAERFTLLYAEAGNPPLKSVATTVGRTGAVDERGRPVRISVQRISDWRRGQNVPARFDALETVLRTLIGMARKQRPYPIVEGLYELGAWRSLWEEALASPALPAESPGASAASGGEPVAAPSTDTGLCPYRGLAEFGEEHADRFFGRDAATAALLARVDSARATGGIVILVGASGAGKSSLLRAGLVPALAALDVPPRTVVTRPGEGPVEQLRALRLEPDGTVDGEPEGGPVASEVLVVDQFEELFTLCDDEGERETYVRMLHAATAAGGKDGGAGAAVVVLGVRADFYDQLLGYPELAEALQSRQMVLGPMSSAELGEAVTGPAKTVGLRLESGLVELLTRDLGLSGGRPRARGGRVAYEAGVLPLLSHALLATWQRRQSGRLTIAGYRAAGGINGAVEATAERAWDGLTSDEQGAALTLLLLLTRIGDDSQDTRRRVEKQKLIEQTGNRAAAESALEALARARLVTLDADRVQITHEALLHAWPRLHGWIAENRQGLLARQRLEEDAGIWDDQARDPSGLYRGARLESVAQVVGTAGPDRSSELARAFLAASRRNHRRRVWGLRAAVVVVVVLALLAGTAAVLARNQRDDAQFAEVVTRADQLRTVDPALSAQLDLVAHRMRPDDRDVIGRVLSDQNVPLARPLPAASGAIYYAAYSPDGRTLATASAGKAVQLWDLSDPARARRLGPPLTAGSGWISSAVFSPDGHTLAASGEDGLVRLWNITDPRHPAPLTAPLNGHDGSISLLAYSPDGRLLASANDDHTVRLWNVADPAHPQPLGAPLAGHTALVRAVAFSPDSRTLVSGGDDRTLLLWDVSDPAHPARVGAPMVGHTGLVQSVAFSPDGRTVASGSADTTAQLWNVADRAHPTPLGARLTGHTGLVWSVAFSPDGRLLATGSADGSVKLWNVASPGIIKLRETLPAPTGGIDAVGFSPDGRTLAGGSEDGTTLLWTLPPTVLAGAAVPVRSTVFSPDGRLLATGISATAPILWNVADPTRPEPLDPLGAADTSYRPSKVAFRPDGRVLASSLGGGDPVRLWDLSDPAHPAPLGQPLAQRSQYSNPIAFSPDGRLLATADTDQLVRLWDVRDPTHPVPTGPELPGHQSYVSWVSFSPDGHLLATSSSDATILWDVHDPAHTRRVGTQVAGPAQGQVGQSDFSPDSRLLATTGEDGKVRLWGVADPAHPTLVTTLAADTKRLQAVAFSPDGRTLAAGGTDQSAQLWDVTDPSRPAPVPVTLTGHSAIVNSAAFSPDGRVVVTGSNDGTAMVWRLSVDDASRRVCVTTGGSLAPSQWHQYLPQLAYTPPCPAG